MRAVAKVSSADVDDLAEELADTAHALAQVLAQPLSARASEVTASQYEALLVVEDIGPVTATELADALGIDRSTTTRLCDRLSARRLILRERSKRSGREVQIELSDEGRALLDAINRERRDYFLAIARSVAEDVRGALLCGLEEVSEHARGLF